MQKKCAGCHHLFYFLSKQIGKKKFSVIMRYYCEDIISISLVWKQIINETKKSKVLNFGGTIFQGNKMGLQIEQKNVFLLYWDVYEKSNIFHMLSNTQLGAWMSYTHRGNTLCAFLQSYFPELPWIPSSVKMHITWTLPSNPFY